jgi:hypothetical protein
MRLIERSRIARARGLAQAISECRDDARIDGIRECAAEIAELLDLPITDDRGAVDRVAELEAELAKMRESRDAWRLQAMREHDAAEQEQ